MINNHTKEFVFTEENFREPSESIEITATNLVLPDLAHPDYQNIDNLPVEKVLNIISNIEAVLAPHFQQNAISLARKDTIFAAEFMHDSSTNGSAADKIYLENDPHKMVSIIKKSKGSGFYGQLIYFINDKLKTSQSRYEALDDITISQYSTHIILIKIPSSNSIILVSKLLSAPNSNTPGRYTLRPIVITGNNPKFPDLLAKFITDYRDKGINSLFSILLSNMFSEHNYSNAQRASYSLYSPVNPQAMTSFIKINLDENLQVIQT